MGRGQVFGVRRCKISRARPFAVWGWVPGRPHRAVRPHGAAGGARSSRGPGHTTGAGRGTMHIKQARRARCHPRPPELESAQVVRLSLETESVHKMGVALAKWQHAMTLHALHACRSAVPHYCRDRCGQGQACMLTRMMCIHHVHTHRAAGLVCHSKQHRREMSSV